MSLVLAIIFFVLGLIIGSFLNVVIFRYGTHRPFRGRSHCLVCQNQLRWHELVPLISFIWLKGRCRNCRTRISLQYPLVEFIAGAVFLGLFIKFQDLFFSDTLGFSLTYGYYATVFSILLVISVYDLKHKIIPDKLVLILGIITFLGLFFFSADGFLLQKMSLLDFSTGILIALPLALLWLVSKGSWMGLGDAKLALSLGWILGPALALAGLIAAFWSGAIAGFLLIIFSRKHKIKSEIPFAPFLVFGAILVFLFGFHFFPFVLN